MKQQKICRWLAHGLMLSVVSLVLSVGNGCTSATPIALEFDEDSYGKIRSEFEFAAGGGESAVSALEDPNRTPQWGSVTGHVKVDDPGGIPTLPPIPVTKEQNICGTTSPNEAIEVSSDGGIKNVLIFLKTDLPVNDCDAETPVWVHGSYSFDKVAAGDFPMDVSRQQSLIVFDQKKCVFLSHMFAMRVAQQMKIINSDNTLHNTNISAKLGKQANESIPAFGHTFYQPTAQEDEPFPVTCNVHPWMRANMIVRNNPYFDVTQEDGSFRIPHVPAGVELEYRIWQEKAGFISAKQTDETVKLNGEAIDVKKGTFKLSLDDSQTLDLQIEIKSTVFK
jgi:hypothetical protein